MHTLKRHRRSCIPVCITFIALIVAGRGFAQPAGAPQALYDALKAFELQTKASVSNLTLKRDRGEMTFTGDFYFAAPVNGRVTGAVFIGEGRFRAPAPDIPFEKENLKRFLGEESVDSDFKTAVLRFTDDTYDIIGKGSAAAAAPSDATKLAQGLDPSLLKETGANISARLATSIANNESPGFFLAQFDKGKLKCFTFLVDPQCRIPNYTFEIDAGEKVVLFRYDSYAYSNDLLIATYSEEDFTQNRVSYSDDYDVADPKHYRMEIDLRKARNELRTDIRIDFKSLIDNLQAIPMVLNENITEYNNERLKHSMRVQSASYKGQAIPCIQEDWETGLTFLLPEPVAKDDEFSIDVVLAGDFIDDQQQMRNSHYPQGNSSWYPRHGFIKNSTFELIFRHSKGDTISSVGTLVSEGQWPDSDDGRTEYKMETPISFASFVAGILKPHNRKRKLEFGDMELLFYSPPTSADLTTVKEEFVLNELGNVLDYFSSGFGPYPYESIRSTFRSRGASRPFATMMTVPGMDSADRNSYKYIGTEASKQWWGCVVNSRSYRDQWLEDGLSEYSGLLYVLARMKNIKEQKEFLDVMRFNLKNPPQTDTGVGQGKISEIGPVILGRRLRTRNSMNSASMVTQKGTLVVRMLHYLFSDPQTGDDARFFEMIRDYTDSYAFRAASTDDFKLVANRHFVNTPVAKAFGLKDLNWFFQQWIYEAKLPSYRLEYKIESGEGGQAVVTGNLIQENAGPNWFMPLPIVLKFSGNQQAQSIVYVNGPETAVNIPLPMKPNSVELDPDMWILSEKTETKKR